MSSSKRWNLKNLFTARGGGCGCGPKSTDAIEPKSIPKTSFSDQNPTRRSATSSWDRYGGDSSTSTTFSLNNVDSSPQFCPENHEYDKCPKKASRRTKIDDSLAVVKDSDNPYRDFRQSMLQMIYEKQIYSRSDLQQLLHCLLELNSAHHHEVIVRAFVEIWNGGAAVVDGGDGRFPPLGSREYA
ncbi:hypothetical protein DH2020_028088 [Rehmannia glutinosa]|uniref:Transcription repressor n=1 Tax=Rehmannia glutinosa TaxID=99300 RepID=A0ABR0VSC8_REHGL